LRVSASELIAAHLRRQIEGGLLVPGQRIVQREIAATFAVSTTPVREALQILQAQGVIRIDPNKGAVVARPSPAEIREMYEIRKALEALAVTSAVGRLTDSDYRELRELQAEMRAATSRPARAAANQRFHELLYAASGMPRLCSLISQLRSAASYYVEAAYETAKDAELAAVEHERILKACQAGDRKAATAATRAHLERSAVRAVESAEFLRGLAHRNIAS
jgi:DNA-binding GntR family transcriptional regulator